MGPAESLGDRAAVLQRRARDAFNNGRPVDARRLLNRATALLERVQPPDRDTQRVLVQVLMTAGLCDADLDGVEAGRACLDHAEQLARDLGDHSLLALVAGNRGLVETRAGDLARAVSALDRAVELLEHMEPRGRLVALLNRGMALMLKGELAAAHADTLRAAEVAAATGYPIDRMKALHNLGYIDFLSGDIPSALARLIESTADTHVPPNAISHLDRARVLSEAGLTREADDALALAAELARASRLWQDLGEVELERARIALVAGDVEGARRLARSARGRFRRRGSESWRRESELLLLQADVASGRAGAAAQSTALRLRDELAADGLLLSAATAARLAAETQLAGGFLDDARTTLSTVPDVAAAPITAVLHERYVLARLAERAGDDRAAQHHVRAGLKRLADRQATLGSVDLQTASAVHGRRLAEFGIAMALRGGRPAGVFAAAEQARAVSARLRPVTPPEDPASARLLSELRQVVENLRETNEASPTAAALRRRRRELEHAVAERRWTLGRQGMARPIATLAQVRTALTDSTMVMYVQTGPGVTALCVDGRSGRLVDLGPLTPVVEQIRRLRADLDAAAQSVLPPPLRDAVAASARRTLAALDDSLIRPLGPGVADRRLVLVSTGSLGQLPWGLLPSLRGTPVTVAPSATGWLAAESEPSSRRRFSVAAVAGPDLDRAGHEIKGVLECWPERAVPVPATEREVTAALRRHRVVHVAAHGVHQTENPLFSSLRLTDGPLFAHELDQNERVPEHVVLSACELGLATVRPGDEALGLTSVLLHLGTRSVVAGVARVGDEAAEEAMVAYHRGLAAGLDSAAALARVTERMAVPFVNFGGVFRPPARFGK